MFSAMRSKGSWGDEYNIRAPTQFGGLNNEQTIQELRLYIKARWRTSDALSFYAKTGSTIAGDYEIRGSNGTTGGVIQPAWFVEIGAGFSF